MKRYGNDDKHLKFSSAAHRQSVERFLVLRRFCTQFSFGGDPDIPIILIQFCMFEAVLTVKRPVNRTLGYVVNRSQFIK